MVSLAEKIDDILVRYLAHLNYKGYVHKMGLRGNEKILEVGCGGANLSRFLAQRLPCGELTSIDHAGYWICTSQKRLSHFDNILFRTIDLIDYRRDSYFDVVVISYVLHDIAEKEKAVRVIWGNLKSGGTVFIREPTRKSHGIASEEIKRLMTRQGFFEKASCEGDSLPLRGTVYEGIFQKGPS